MGSCASSESSDWAIEEVLSNPFGAPTYNDKASGSNTVVIFDWDDTLLCSTAVRSQQWRVQQLERLEAAITSILRTSMGLGETLIVTNGNKTWVEDSARRFLPGLLPLLKKLRVVSARSLYESKYPGDPFMWKVAAFEQLLTKERHFAPKAGLNLVALGDQFPEIDAARHVGQVIGGASSVKTVKFCEAPTVDEVIGQLGRTEQLLGEIVEEADNHSYGLVLRESVPFFGPPASEASSWLCVTEGETAQDCVGSVARIKGVLGLVN